MKKILILFTAMVAVGASASTIAWGVAGAMFNGTTQMKSTEGYSTSAYLIYLGSSGSTWDGFDIASFAKDTSSAVATKTATALGTVSYSADNYTCAVGGTINNTSAKLTDGDSVFGILLLSSGTGFGDTKSYYYQSDAFTYSESDASRWSAATSTYTMTQAVPSGSTWTAVPAVPEPATGALALAGIALLLKRRKAAKA